MQKSFYSVLTTIMNVQGPEYFMDKGVVMVMVNYRLGPFGFFADGIHPG